jgi:Fe-S cluster assembly scaffold protein SufB
MIIERDSTILLDLIAQDDIEIVVKEGVRVTVIDYDPSIHPSTPSASPNTPGINAALSSHSVRPELVEGFNRTAQKGLTERYKNIILIAERNSTILYEALLKDAAHTKKITTCAHGEGADIQVRIGVIAKNEEHHTIETKQLHEAPHSMSNLIIKSIGYDHSYVEYTGMIAIDNNACKTEAHQQHKALLLNPQARAYARPSIEVEVDDVQCGHGSAIGQLDQEQLFYLHARGIADKRSKDVLLYAFMRDLFQSNFFKNIIYEQFSI